MSPEPKKIDPVIKSKWVSALRGDKYEQGRGRLRTNDGNYCCLGVLADVLGEGWINIGTAEEPMYALARNDGGSSYGYLPEDLCNEVGLEEYFMTELAEMNDQGKPFGIIADFIEQRIR